MCLSAFQQKVEVCHLLQTFFMIFFLLQSLYSMVLFLLINYKTIKLTDCVEFMLAFQQKKKCTKGQFLLTVRADGWQKSVRRVNLPGVITKFYLVKVYGPPYI